MHGGVPTKSFKSGQFICNFDNCGQRFDTEYERTKHKGKFGHKQKVPSKKTNNDISIDKGHIKKKAHSSSQKVVDSPQKRRKICSESPIGTVQEWDPAGFKEIGTLVDVYFDDIKGWYCGLSLALWRFKSRLNFSTGTKILD